VHRTGDACLKIEEGRYLANNIPNAKFIELPGIDHLPFVGKQDEILDEIEDFLTSLSYASVFNRVLATVLSVRLTQPLAAKAAATATEIVSAAQTSLQTNPLAALMQRHPTFFKKEVAFFKGRALASDGEHLLATFDGPARAIRSACAIHATAKRLGAEVHIGLHTGECDVISTIAEANFNLSGHAVNIAGQLSQQANTGEILVSSTVKDLVSGSGIRFNEHGTQTLPDDLGEWRLYSVEQGGVFLLGVDTRIGHF
jgi:class 3 adenylate cyclase